MEKAKKKGIKEFFRLATIKLTEFPVIFDFVVTMFFGVIVLAIGIYNIGKFLNLNIN